MPDLSIGTGFSQKRIKQKAPEKFRCFSIEIKLFIQLRLRGFLSS